MTDLALRIADGLLGVFWAIILIRALASGTFGLGACADRPRKDRPLFYWFILFVYALMVLHFIGLAVVGQSR